MWIGTAPEWTTSPPVGTPRKREEVPTGGQEQWFLTAADREK